MWNKPIWNKLMRDFAQKLLSGASHPQGKRFALYQNNVMMSLIEALRTRFPVVEKLVGDMFFNQMAREFIRFSPPTSPIIWQYGANFSSFIQEFSPAQSVPYLSEVARLEAAIAPIFHAQDEMPIDLNVLLAQDLENITLTFAKAFALIKSDYAVLPLWQMHQEGAEIVPIDIDTPSFIALYRRDFEVHLDAIDQAFFMLLTHLQSGFPLAKAITESGFSEDDLTKAFHFFLKTNLLTSFSQG
jgi:hypothetical protein